jgi:hypothetical protein
MNANPDVDIEMTLAVESRRQNYGKSSCSYFMTLSLFSLRVSLYTIANLPRDQ